MSLEAMMWVSGGACVLLVAVARLLPPRKNTYEADERKRFREAGWIVPPERKREEE
jgi:hypothetical protein